MLYQNINIYSTFSSLAQILITLLLISLLITYELLSTPELKKLLIPLISLTGLTVFYTIFHSFL